VGLSVSHKDFIGQYGLSSRFTQWYADRTNKYGDANMMVVIACGARKKPKLADKSGHMATKKGRPIMFVADPKKAAGKSPVLYKCPDDDAGNGRSWREKLLEYNREYRCDPSYNPFALHPAWKLYDPPKPNQNIYQELVCTFGTQNVFILSGGWGLISADFLTPNYDITLSHSAAEKKPWALRQRHDHYADSVMLKDTGKPVVFLGGKDYYLPFFRHLKDGIKSERIVFYYGNEPHALGCILYPFSSNTPRNWYYECGKHLCEAKKELTESENP